MVYSSYQVQSKNMEIQGIYSYIYCFFGHESTTYSLHSAKKNGFTHFEASREEHEKEKMYTLLVPFR